MEKELFIGISASFYIASLFIYKYADKLPFFLFPNKILRYGENEPLRIFLVRMNFWGSFAFATFFLILAFICD